MNTFNRKLRLIKSGTKKQLVCFHFAGGSAEYFQSWKDDVEEDTALYAVQLPGRGQRISEPFVTCLHRLADGILPILRFLPSRPTYFFGHSMGAILAFEVAVRFEKQGQALERLFVSGRVPPQISKTSNYSKQNDEELLDTLKSFGGTDQDFFQAEALQQLMLPILRADLEAIEGYSYQGKDCLNCPVTACMGKSDTEVTYDEMCQWQTVTEGDFELDLFDGGHFYLNDGRSELLDFMNKKFIPRA